MEPINDAVRLSIFTKLPLDIQELFLEAAVIFKSSGKQYQSPVGSKLSGLVNFDRHKQYFNKWLLNLMRHYLIDTKISIERKQPMKMTTISILMYGSYSDNKRFRYFDKAMGTWHDSTEAMQTQCQRLVSDMLMRQDKSPYGWYGIANYDKFYLKDTSKLGAQNKGEDCSTIPVWKLYSIIMKINKARVKRSSDILIDIPSKKDMLLFLNPPDAKKQTQFQIMMSEPSIKQSIAKMLKGTDHNQAIASIYWYANRKMQKQRLCEDIQQMLAQDNYIIGYYLTAKQQPKTTKILPRNLKQRNR